MKPEIAELFMKFGQWLQTCPEALTSQDPEEIAGLAAQFFRPYPNDTMAEFARVLPDAMRRLGPLLQSDPDRLGKMLVKVDELAAALAMQATANRIESRMVQ